ncbi:GNAT family N-acetyltransferase [Paenibacillus sp. OV219]|uniref:GNAT family N-acetyltransferase n=1 Tax=Paenibacillus sp. OV219 TaxID=1884377 RepID=UPI0008C45BDA|nr:GNAT family N-acetyltransferase [Paenibacillus sp. OV219]SEO22483.1 Acetyltransferase (GNAT) family protein [Paenibacillus sp. OV219]
MKVKLLSPSQWPASKEKITRFLYRYGDKRITTAALAALQELAPARLSASRAGGSGGEDGAGAGASVRSGEAGAGPEAAIAIAVVGGKLAAVAFAEDGGERACFVVVSPEFRGQGAGSSLLAALQRRLGRLACTVAADNPASMSMCFRAGMKAVSLHTGPTGKPTLRFES